MSKEIEKLIARIAERDPDNQLYALVRSPSYLTSQVWVENERGLIELGHDQKLTLGQAIRLLNALGFRVEVRLLNVLGFRVETAK